MSTSFPTPGRGAWTRTGGLLPVKPGNRNPAGFYRRGAAGEVDVGRSFATRADLSHHARVVNLGVRVIQQMCGQDIDRRDGIFGPATDADVRRLQLGAGLKVDGIVGRETMKAGLGELITDMANANNVPVEILGGVIMHESAMDPAAVGVNGADHGLAQINLAAHTSVSVEQALDVEFALLFTVDDLAHQYEKWDGRTKNKVDAWNIAIANHNSPALAVTWARTGAAPFVPGRVFQIEEYVQRVRSAWSGATHQ